MPPTLEGHDRRPRRAGRGAVRRAAGRALRSGGDRRPAAVHRGQPRLPRARAGGPSGRRVPPRASTTPRARGSCSPRTARTPSCARCSRRLAPRIAELEEEIRLAMVERDPNDDKNVIVEIRPGRRRRGGGAVGRRHLPDAHPLRRAPRVHARAAVGRRRHLHVRGQGRRGLLGVQVRGRHAPRAAGAGDRVPGPDPHLDGDRRRAAGGRGRRGRGRPERPPDRRLPVLRARRPVGQHDRLGGADHPQADRHRRLDAGREVAAPEPRAGDASAARPAVRAGAGRAAGRGRGLAARRRSGPASAPRRSAPTTSREKRVTDHRIKLRVHNLDAC